MRIGFAACAVGVSLYAVISRWDTISSDLARIGWLGTLGSIPFLFAALACGMLSWRRLLRGLGSPLPLTSAARIYFVGQLGKYLPGSVWPVVSQMELGKDHAIPRRRSVTALLIAVLVSLATGVLTGAATLPFLLGNAHPWLWYLLGLVPVLLVLLYPRLLWPLLRRIPRLNLAAAIGEPMSERTMLGAVSWSLVGWFTYGLHVALLATAFPHGDLGRVLVMSVGGFALAWCAGMIAFFLPAGAGARDVALVLALSAVISTNAAVAVAVVSRAVTILADLCWAGLAMAAMPRPYKGDLRANSQPEVTADRQASSDQFGLDEQRDYVSGDPDFGGEQWDQHRRRQSSNHWERDQHERLRPKGAGVSPRDVRKKPDTDCQQH